MSPEAAEKKWFQPGGLKKVAEEKEGTLEVRKTTANKMKPAINLTPPVDGPEEEPE